MIAYDMVTGAETLANLSASKDLVRIRLPNVGKVIELTMKDLDGAKQMMEQIREDSALADDCDTPTVVRIAE